MSQKQIKKYGGALAKGLISQIPVVGALSVELLNVTIPNQRQEKIEKLLNLLASKVFNISEQELNERFHSTNFIDVYEDVLLQAIRATTSERLEYLASALKKGLTDENFDNFKTKRLLEILAKINDVEVILLQSCALNKSQSEFKQKHSNIFDLKDYIYTHNAPTLDETAKNKKALLDHYEDNLVSLGLIGLKHQLIYRHKLFSTYLGTQLLELIGLDVEIQEWANPVTSVDVSKDLFAESQQIQDNIKNTKEKATKELKQETQKALEKFT